MPEGGTVQPFPILDATADARALNDALKAFVAKKKDITNILAKRTVFQRNLIAKTYKSIYGEDLITKLNSKLSGDFKQCVNLSFYDAAHVNAKTLFKSCGSQLIIDIVCTSTNEEIIDLQNAYNDVLNEAGENSTLRTLETDLVKATTGNFQQVVIALIQGNRHKTSDGEDAKSDCEALFKAGEGKLGTDDSMFIKIFVSRSWETIRNINKLYQEKHGHDLLVAIDKETSGNYRKALQTIVKMAMDKTKCLAEILYETMKGIGTQDDNLIRIIIGRSEVDLAVIRYVYNKTYKESLSDMVKGDTSSDYCDYLLAILCED